MKRIKRNRLVMFILTVLAIVLEALPYGVIVRSTDAQGELLRETYSYFSLIPLKSGNIGPFLAAILSCLLALLCLFFLIKQCPKDSTVLLVISALNFLASFMALFKDLTSFSLLCGAVCLLLGAETILAFQKPKEK